MSTRAIELLRTLRSRRIAIWSAVAAALVGVYTLAGFFLVPRIVRSQALSFVQQNYGRSLTLGEVRFNPFTLTLRLRDVSFPDSAGEPLAGLGGLLVNAQLSSIWRRGPVFKDIELERPFARVIIRPDGSLNLADLGKPFEGKPKAPQPAKPAAPLRVFITRLVLVDGRVAFEDRTHPTPFATELAPVNLELRDFNTLGTGNDAYSLSAATQAGERFDWSGTLGMTPFGSRGHFAVSQLQARTIWSYLRSSVPFELSSGVIDLAGDYELTTGGSALGLLLAVSNVSLKDLGVKPAGAAQDYVHLAQLQVANTHFDLAQRAVDVGPVRLSGGIIHAWLDQSGALNLLDLYGAKSAAKSTGTNAAAPPSGTAAPPASGASTPPPPSWKIAVPDIALEGWTVTAEDRQVQPTAAQAQLDNLNVHVTGFSTAADAKLTITTSLRINQTGKLSATATLAPGGAVQAHAELAQLDLTAVQPYLAQRTALSLLSGQLDTKVDFGRGADGVIAVSADATVNKLRTVDDELEKDFVKWDRLTVENIQYRSKPQKLSIRSITAQAPYARVIVAADRTLNLAEAFSTQSALKRAQAAAAAAASAPKLKQTTKQTAAVAESRAPPALAISIGTVRVLNGSANYQDLWIQPNFAIGIQSLSGSITGLSSDPRSRAKIELDGKVDRYAPARIWGEVNLLAAALYTDIKMSFKGVELSSVTPYSGRFAGYKIEKGKLSIDLGYHIENRQLNADHHFVIDQLQLGEKVDSPDAVKLPLKLAVALLKDRNGVIDVPLPITGSLDDPDFHIGPIIWHAVVNLLVKAATAPFALLGRLFGGGEQMNQIDFDPGSALLDKAGQERLAGLLKSLQERPGLELDVPSVASPTLDKASLAARRLHQQLLTLHRRELARGARGSPADDEAALADPREHYRLLLLEYHAELGVQAPLPPEAQAIEAAKHAKEQPPLEPAITALEGALAARVVVSDNELEALGKQRAQAIQDALLSGGAVDPARVFMIAGPADAAADGKVRAELSLK